MNLNATPANPWSDIPVNDPQEAKDFFARKLSFTLGPVDLQNRLGSGTEFTIIDVRQADDYKKEHIPGAIHLPEGRWSSLAGLQKSLTNVIYCYSQDCHLAARAAFQFASLGYPVVELEGGFAGWKAHSFAVEGEEGLDEEKRSA